MQSASESGCVQWIEVSVCVCVCGLCMMEGTTRVMCCVCVSVHVVYVHCELME